MSERSAKVELEYLKKNPDFHVEYDKLIQAFRKSGLLNFLRSVAHCYLFDGGMNPTRAAAEASYNAGYHKCLDDIMYFQEEFLTESAGKTKRVPMDFGGRRLALSRWDLLESDFDNKEKK